MSTIEDTAAFSKSVHGTGHQGDRPHFIISADPTRQPGSSGLSAIHFHVGLNSVSVHTYLTADQAALLGKTLLDAATVVQHAQVTEDILVASVAAMTKAEGGEAA